ncbi:dipeptidase [Paenibacillus hunanensis]|uniref:dipeptidase n=1 Tax=Paenibacillus hunanensis TaxID=539262 RepID=UPI0020263D06|nr:dipeptidase [Paenibacillus hunanensis]MCL9659523.1 dipeptidase [Paenibacillus hunanensis]
MGYIDLHCDTLLLFARPHHTGDLRRNDLQVDLDKLARGGAYAQFFAIFMMPEEFYAHLQIEPLADDVYYERLYRAFRQQFIDEDDTAEATIARFAGNYEQYAANRKAGKLSAFLTIEDGRLLNGNLDTLDQWYTQGVRLITLTWNDENSMGYPQSSDPQLMQLGLKPFGIETVQRMNELGIIVDVSHLSDGGFWDVVEHSNRPFVASHSNSRTLSPHPRNLTDEMITALGNKGGLAGLNFGGNFLNETIADDRSTVKQMVRHIQHMVDLGGVESVALGSDFDGVPRNLEIDDASQVPLLAERLHQHGFHPSDIDKIMFGNVERLIRETL